jgi:hypothetical protein
MAPGWKNSPTFKKVAKTVAKPKNGILVNWKIVKSILLLGYASQWVLKKDPTGECES